MPVLQSRRHLLLLWFALCDACFSLHHDATGTLHHTESSRVKIIKPFQSPPAQTRLYDKKNSFAARTHRMRSYLDNQIETLPAHPGYSAIDAYQVAPPMLELNHRLHIPYTQDMFEDVSLDYTMSPKLHTQLFTDEHLRSSSPDAVYARPLEDDIDLTSLLSPDFDLQTPVSGSAKALAGNILQEFLNFLELKASGALNECVRARK